MHVTCICGGDHPACVDDDDENTWKMSMLEKTTDHNLVTCPMCRGIISWDPDDN